MFPPIAEKRSYSRPNNDTQPIAIMRLLIVEDGTSFALVRGFKRENEVAAMKHTFTLWVGLLALSFIWMGCGSNSQGFSDSFRLSETVSNGVVLQSINIEGDFRITVTSFGVSSGFVRLNDKSLATPDNFKNVFSENTLVIDLMEDNTIEVEIRGQPGDQLCVRIYEIQSDGVERDIFVRCVDRQAGPPNNVTEDVSSTL